ncbi:MAG TPA: hypothetical protein DCX89_06905 [Saprospirales bacterium]|nr:hypothetical protein [Saprospirales bacterium]HRQ30200.1 CRISPR-associated protein [Saprospiraceae bacterium]
MLINLSNHPFSSWPENQQQAAIKQYGEVTDLPFPHIDPSADHDQVLMLAEDHLSKIRKMPPATVHLMGELTFCFILAGLLRKDGIPCVSSTTRREVVMHHNVKTAVFEFVKFRPYY